MNTDLTEQITNKVSMLPYEKQREVLRIVESLAQHDMIEHVTDSYTLPSLVTDEDERARLLHNLVERMKANPIPANAPHFTREELHERR